MKRRLYFIAPTKRSAKEIDRDAMLARVDGIRIRYMAEADRVVEDLPQAGPMQTNDLVRAVRVGLLSGGLTGAVGGLLLFVLGGPNIAFGWVLASTVIGALFGVFAATLVAASVRSKPLRPFDRELGDGKILVMIDVPKKRIEAVLRLIMSRHPEADVRDSHTTIPALP
jgi:hypothetical protein